MGLKQADLEGIMMVRNEEYRIEELSGKVTTMHGEQPCVRISCEEPFTLRTTIFNTEDYLIKKYGESHDIYFRCKNKEKLDLCKMRFFELIKSSLWISQKQPYIDMDIGDIEAVSTPVNRGKHYNVSLNPGEAETAIEQMKQMIEQDNDIICGAIVCLERGGAGLWDACGAAHSILDEIPKYPNSAECNLITLLLCGDEEDSAVGHLDVWTFVDG